MKLLLVLAVVLLAVWLWRRGRSQEQQKQGRQGVSPQPPTSETGTAPMRSCLHCGLHFPAEEAVQGKLGIYCSPAHRIAAGDSAPAP